jgi:DNA polymerase III epsilon subunit-like protein
VHGISQADCEGKPTIAEIALLLPGPIMAIAHNAQFDLRVLHPHITAKGHLCTLSLSRQFIKGTTNHKLSTLKDELGLSVQASHSALGDVLTVRDLLLKLLPLSGRGIRELFTLQAGNRLVHRFPYGMFKGHLTMEMPVDYRNWMLRQDIDKDIRYTLTFFKKLGI